MFRVFITIITSWVFVSNAAGEGTKDIKVGVITSLTGDFSILGDDVKRGAEVAKEELVKSGVNVALIFEDDKCLPKDAVNGFKKLSSIDQVDIIVGPGCTGAIAAVGPVAERARLPVVALLDTNEVTKKAGESTFVLGFDAGDLSGIIAEEMIKRGEKVTGVLYEADAWSEYVSTEFKSRYEKLGGKVSEVVMQQQGDADYRPNLTRLISKKPEALFLIPAFNGGKLLKQVRAMGIKLQLYGPDTLGNQASVDEAGGEAEGIVFANILLDETNEHLKKLSNSIKEKYGKEPVTPFYAALGYDGVKIAARAAASNDSALEALKKIECADCVTQAVKFDNERMAKIAPSLLTINSGRVVRVK